MPRFDFWDLLWIVIGFIVLLMFFRLSLILIVIFVVGIALFYLIQFIVLWFQGRVEGVKKSHYDREGRRITRVDILEMKDAEEKPDERGHE